jgi:hypothetical protein
VFFFKRSRTELALKQVRRMVFIRKEFGRKL